MIKVKYGMWMWTSDREISKAACGAKRYAVYLTDKSFYIFREVSI